MPVFRPKAIVGRYNVLRRSEAAGGHHYYYHQAEFPRACKHGGLERQSQDLYQRGLEIGLESFSTLMRKEV